MHRTDVVAQRVARATAGLARSHDLVAAGIASSTISRRVRAGVWARPCFGVVDVSRDRWTWERRVVMAVLACGPGTVASHSTAAFLLRFPGFARGAVEVTTSRAARSRVMPFVVHSSLVEDRAARPVDGIPCASPTRTLLGLAAAGVGDRDLHRAVRDVLRRGLATIGTLTDDRLAHLPGRRRVLDAATAERSAALHRVDSLLEDEAIDVIRRWGLPPFETQHVVRTPHSRYRIDIAWPDWSVGLEVDGAAWHDDSMSIAADERREADLRSAGWRLTRVRAWHLEDGNQHVLRRWLQRSLGDAVRAR